MGKLGNLWCFLSRFKIFCQALTWMPTKATAKNGQNYWNLLMTIKLPTLFLSRRIFTPLLWIISPTNSSLVENKLRLLLLKSPQDLLPLINPWEKFSVILSVLLIPLLRLVMRPRPSRLIPIAIPTIRTIWWNWPSSNKFFNQGVLIPSDWMIT